MQCEIYGYAKSVSVRYGLLSMKSLVKKMVLRCHFYKQVPTVVGEIDVGFNSQLP